MAFEKLHESNELIALSRQLRAAFERGDRLPQPASAEVFINLVACKATSILGSIQCHNISQSLSQYFTTSCSTQKAAGLQHVLFFARLR